MILSPLKDLLGGLTAIFFMLVFYLFLFNIKNKIKNTKKKNIIILYAVAIGIICLLTNLCQTVIKHIRKFFLKKICNMI
jgi:hypothetical protein